MDKPLALVLPGETLETDVLDVKGRLLFPKGATLTASAIEALRLRGVASVSVVGETVPLNAELLEKAAERARKYYTGTDLTASPGPVLLGLRTEAEAQRMERGLPPVLKECRGPMDEVPLPTDLPLFSLDNFQPPELPAVAYELNRVLFGADPSTQEVVSIIERSPGLTSRLLRLVNSPLYGFHGRVETVSRAVTIVGLREIGMLASSLVMIENFGVIPPSVIEMRSFIEHCLSCALASKTLAEVTGLAEAEQAFVAGLLHDLGRLFFFTAFPERSRFCVASARQHGQPLMVEEVRFFGTDHAVMGQRILEQWGMPEALSHAAGYHHDLSLIPEDRLTAVVHMADVLAHALGLGNSGECGPPPLSPALHELIPVRPDQLADIAARICDQFEAISAAFH